MRPFMYQRASDPGAAAAALAASTGNPPPTEAAVQALAGGTTLIDLMKLDVMRPQALVDINPLAGNWSEINLDGGNLRLGALARMSDVAAHQEVQRQFPVIAQSLQLAASPQLRNMATLGGNVLQRTRCPYYRDVSWRACNKRTPGSGCAAKAGFNRNHAVLGVDASCISQYPGDFAVALVALDAKVDLVGRDGPRSIDFSTLHRPLNNEPHVETTLRDGEVIVG